MDRTNVVITHCGSQIVNGDPRSIAAAIQNLGDQFGVRFLIANAGMDPNPDVPINRNSFFFISQDTTP